MNIAEAMAAEMHHTSPELRGPPSVESSAVPWKRGEREREREREREVEELKVCSTVEIVHYKFV